MTAADLADLDLADMLLVCRALRVLSRRQASMAGGLMQDIERRRSAIPARDHSTDLNLGELQEAHAEAVRTAVHALDLWHKLGGDESTPINVTEKRL